MLEELACGSSKLLVSGDLEMRDGQSTNLFRTDIFESTAHCPNEAEITEQLHSADQQRKRKDSCISPEPMIHVAPKPLLQSSRPFDEATDCVVCGNSSSQPDTRCKSVRYCSKSCQETDWPSHRLLCKKFCQLGPRPSPAHRRAIYFPQDKTQPILIWIPCEKVMDDVGTRFEYPHAARLLGKDDPIPEDVLLHRNPRRNQQLSDSIEIVFRETFLKDGSKPNQSIARCVGASAPIWHRWLGPAVVLRRKGNVPDPRFYGDITLTDYRHALDYFKPFFDSDNSIGASQSPLPIRALNNITSVKETCAIIEEESTELYEKEFQHAGRKDSMLQ